MSSSIHPSTKRVYSPIAKVAVMKARNSDIPFECSTEDYVFVTSSNKSSVTLKNKKDQITDCSPGTFTAYFREVYIEGISI